MRVIEPHMIRSTPTSCRSSTSRGGGGCSSRDRCSRRRTRSGPARQYVEVAVEVGQLELGHTQAGTGVHGVVVLHRRRHPTSALLGHHEGEVAVPFEHAWRRRGARASGGTRILLLDESEHPRHGVVAVLGCGLAARGG